MPRPRTKRLTSVPDRSPGPERLAARPVDTGMPPPEWMSDEAKTEWQRVLDAVRDRPGWLEQTDAALLVSYCVAWSTFLAASQLVDKAGILIAGRSSADKARGGLVKNPALQIQRNAASEMRQCATALGFSPDARGRVNLERVAGRAGHSHAERLLS